MNAYEMHQNGNFLVTHFEGTPDMWNTKPPLMIWTQVLFMKILGVNELAIRLPSAFAAFATCVLLVFFSKRVLRNESFGWIAVFILISTYGYVNLHATRSGDYDALVTFFITASSLVFYHICLGKNYKFLYLFFILSALAVLTKSVTGIMFLPACFLFALLTKNVIPILKSRHFYVGLLLFAIPVLSFYLLREHYNPGYLQAVADNELGGRFFKVIEDHNLPFWYYVNNIVSKQYTIWWVFVPIGLLIGLFGKSQRFKKLTLFLSLLVFSYLLLISAAKTKLQWYDVPLYPLLALIVAIPHFFFFNILKSINWSDSKVARNFLPFLFLIAIIIPSYLKVLDRSFLPVEDSEEKSFYDIGYFLKEAVNGEHEVNNHFLLYDGYYAQNLFYLKMLENKGINLRFKSWEALSENDKVIIPQDYIRQYVQAHYKVDTLSEKGSIITYQILSKK